MFGRVGVVRDGAAVDVGGPNQALVLAVLAASAPDVVSAEALAESLWGDEAGRRSKNTLQVYVANLRKGLDRPGSGSVIETARPGYRLGWPMGSVDVHRALDAHRRATAAARALEWDQVLLLARQVGAATTAGLAVDCADVEALRPLRERVGELGWQATELELEALLALGRPDEVVGPARAALAEQPLRERLWGAYMVALYRVGRQAQALEAYRDARAVLGDLLGLDPGPELQALESAILRQSASLDQPAAGGRSLTWWDRTGRMRVRPLDPEHPQLLIGRDPQADIRLDGDGSVSRRHALVSYAEGRWWVEDLGSSNGTQRNAQPLAGRVGLGHGDLLRIGGVTLVVSEGSQTPPPTVAAGPTVLADPRGPRGDDGLQRI